jgi:small subunit ribosomal protein S4
MERQFRNYFIKAKKIPGVTGDELLRLLERRLDNVVYRLKLASSRKQARQLVNHRHIWVNGRVVDLPSYIVRVGDEIQVKESRQQKPYFKTIKENARTPAADYWLALDTQTLKGKVLRLPTVEEMESTFNPHLVVEYYSNQV